MVSTHMAMDNGHGPWVRCASGNVTFLNTEVFQIWHWLSSGLDDDNDKDTDKDKFKLFQISHPKLSQAEVKLKLCLEKLWKSISSGFSERRNGCPWSQIDSHVDEAAFGLYFSGIPGKVKACLVPALKLDANLQ